MRLDEAGLLRHDLDHLVLPLIEIDTFESKISNEKAVVVAFYVFEQEPAKDLERFIEKGSVDILDAETSPAPTDDGYYVVFIELYRNMDLPEMIMDILESVNNLTDVDGWQFKTLHDETIYDLTEENLRQHVNLDPAAVPPTPEEEEKAEEILKRDIAASEQEPEAEEKPKSKTEPEAEEESPESIEEDLADQAAPMLSMSLAESIEADDDILILRSGGSQLAYRITGVHQDLPSVPVMALQIGDPLIRESSMLSRMLGHAFVVETISGGLLVSGPDGYLTLETVDN